MLAGIEEEEEDDVGGGGGGRARTGLFGLTGLPGANDTASDGGDGSAFVFDLVVVAVVSFGGIAVSLVLT